MLKNRDLIIISSIEWDALWQGPQEIAARMGKAGNRVLYIENTGVRSPVWRDKSRIVRRLKHWASSLRSRGVRQAAPNVLVCSPLVAPPFGPAWLRHLNSRVFLPLVSRTAQKLSMRDPVIWSFLPTDTVLDLINLLSTSSSTVVYHCVADFAHLTRQTAQLRQSERELLRTSDLVFAACRQLAEHCARWNDKVFVYPYGVDLEVFTAEKSPSTKGGFCDRNSPGLAALSALPQPIIGYVGGLHRFVDFHLLAEMARKRPAWSWVFVGSIETSAGELARLPNVHLLGQQPHYQLGNYLRRFDVCIVPYLKSEATKTVVPTKIKEYLAAGKPVVSTDLPTVREFNDQHHVLFTAACQSDCFLQAIERALRSPNGNETVARRREVAKLNDWQVQLDAMSSLITAQMQAKSALNLHLCLENGNHDGKECCDFHSLLES